MEHVARTQTDIARRLLRWSLPSIIVGGVGLVLPWPVVQGFALQALIWGGVDAVIATVGAWGARRRRGRYPDEVQEVRDTLRLRRVLVINGWLDLLYLAGGAAITVLFRTDPFLLGNGVGILVQALFLLFFDILHARRLPAQPPAWYSAQP